MAVGSNAVNGKAYLRTELAAAVYRALLLTVRGVSIGVLIPPFILGV